MKTTGKQLVNQVKAGIGQRLENRSNAELRRMARQLGLKARDSKRYFSKEELVEMIGKFV